MNKIRIIYYVQSPPNTRVILKWREFSVGEERKCKKGDYVRVGKVDDPNYLNSKVFCRNSTSSVRSSGNSMRILLDGENGGGSFVMVLSYREIV